jgi:hypothetical protein
MMNVITIREIQTKTTMRYHFIVTKMAMIYNKKKNSKKKTKHITGVGEAIGSFKHC